MKLDTRLPILSFLACRLENQIEMQHKKPKVTMKKRSRESRRYSKRLETQRAKTKTKKKTKRKRNKWAEKDSIWCLVHVVHPFDNPCCAIIYSKHAISAFSISLVRALRSESNVFIGWCEIYGNVDWLSFYWNLGCVCRICTYTFGFSKCRHTKTFSTLDIGFYLKEPTLASWLWFDIYLLDFKYIKLILKL